MKLTQFTKSKLLNLYMIKLYSLLSSSSSVQLQTVSQEEKKRGQKAKEKGTTTKSAGYKCDLGGDGGGGDSDSESAPISTILLRSGIDDGDQVGVPEEPHGTAALDGSQQGVRRPGGQGGAGGRQAQHRQYHR